MIWNVSVLKGNKNLFGYQVEADNAGDAADKAEMLYGTVVRVCLAKLDED
jgi:hypothetical protein